MTSLLLGLDTAGPHCSVCLYDMASGEIVASREPEIGRGHAERLMGLVAEVLAEASVGYGDLAKLAVVVGPGSFTGLRVGVAAARGLALALEIPLVGVSTLEALAEPWWATAAVLSVTDAKRGEVHAALFGPGGTVLREPAALAPEALGDFVPDGEAGHGLVVVGSGARLAAGFLAPRDLSTGNEAGAVAITAVARIGAGRRDPQSARPLYLRGADAKPQTRFAVRLAVEG